MNPKKIINSFILCQDMINIFTDYAKKLDIYFNNTDNIYKHDDLYNYYLDLKHNLQNVSVKNGIVKK